jgi:hypothetical protein
VQCVAGAAAGLLGISSITPLYCIDVATKIAGPSSVVMHATAADENSLLGREQEYVAISEKLMVLNVSSSSSSSSAASNESLFIRVSPALFNVRVVAVDGGDIGAGSWMIEFKPAREIAGSIADVNVELWYGRGNGSGIALGSVSVTIHVLPCMTSVAEGENNACDSSHTPMVTRCSSLTP